MSDEVELTGMENIILNGLLEGERRIKANEKEICPICEQGYIVKRKGGSYCIPDKALKKGNRYV